MQKTKIRNFSSLGQPQLLMQRNFWSVLPLNFNVFTIPFLLILMIGVNPLAAAESSFAKTVKIHQFPGLPWANSCRYFDRYFTERISDFNKGLDPRLGLRLEYVKCISHGISELENQYTIEMKMIYEKNCSHQSQEPNQGEWSFQRGFLDLNYFFGYDALPQLGIKVYPERQDHRERVYRLNTPSCS